jgi:hypothetical protein
MKQLTAQYLFLPPFSDNRFIHRFIFTHLVADKDTLHRLEPRTCIQCILKWKLFDIASYATSGFLLGIITEYFI